MNHVVLFSKFNYYYWYQIINSRLEFQIIIKVTHSLFQLGFTWLGNYKKTKFFVWVNNEVSLNVVWN